MHVRRKLSSNEMKRETSEQLWVSVCVYDVPTLQSNTMEKLP